MLHSGYWNWNDARAEVLGAPMAVAGAHLLLRMSSWPYGGRIADSRSAYVALGALDPVERAIVDDALTRWWVRDGDSWTHATTAEAHAKGQGLRVVRKAASALAQAAREAKRNAVGQSIGRSSVDSNVHQAIAIALTRSESGSETKITPLPPQGGTGGLLRNEPEGKPNQLALVASGSDSRTDQTPRSAPPPRRSAKSVQVSEIFERFWLAWGGRKIGKTDAAKSWARQGLDAEAAAVAAGHARWVAQWAAQQTEPQFIPHCATWLNKRRWEDDLAPPRQPVPTAAATPRYKLPSRE